MTKKNTRSPVLGAVLSSLLVLSMLGVFGIFAQSTFADDEQFEIEMGGEVSCTTIPAGCMSFGCNGTPGNYTCSLSAQQPGASCTSGGACTVR